MNRTVLVVAAGAFALASGAASAQSQENMTSYGPFRFGVSAGPAASPFDSNAAKFERDNPVNRKPWDDKLQSNGGEGPNLGPEGGGTPMSRGGVYDTLTAPRPGALLGATSAAQPKADAKAKPKSANAKPQGAPRP